MLQSLHIQVEQREIVLTGVPETMIVYGIHEGRHTQQGHYFLAMELAAFPQVVRGDPQLNIYELDRHRALVMIEVQHLNARCALIMEPNAQMT